MLLEIPLAISLSYVPSRAAYLVFHCFSDSLGRLCFQFCFPGSSPPSLLPVPTPDFYTHACACTHSPLYSPLACSPHSTLRRTPPLPAHSPPSSLSGGCCLQDESFPGEYSPGFIQILTSTKIYRTCIIYSILGTPGYVAPLLQKHAVPVNN